jgi:hypothetical protein
LKHHGNQSFTTHRILLTEDENARG